MQYANNGSLLSYLVQNIKYLTWKMKLEHWWNIAFYLDNIHRAGIVHCDLHGGNVVLHEDTNTSSVNSFIYDLEHTSVVKSFICDLGLSRLVNSSEPNSTVQGVLPFIAPEVFHTRKFTQKSDIYSLG